MHETESHKKHAQRGREGEGEGDREGDGWRSEDSFVVCAPGACWAVFRLYLPSHLSSHCVQHCTEFLHVRTCFPSSALPVGVQLELRIHGHQNLLRLTVCIEKLKFFKYLNNNLENKFSLISGEDNL